MYLRHFTIYLLLFCCCVQFATSCRTREPISKKMVNGELVEGKITHANVFDGEIKFYDNEGKVYKKAMYRNGFLDGFVVKYNSDGSVLDSLQFINGVKNGYQYNNSPSGKPERIYYSFHGIICGPTIFFKNGRIHKSMFLDLHKKPICDIDYDSSGFAEVKEFSTETRISNFYLNGKKVSSIFMYTPQFPGISAKYSLGVTDSFKNDSILFSLKEGNSIFFDTMIPRLLPGKNFIVLSHLEGSGIKKVFIEDLKY